MKITKRKLRRLIREYYEEYLPKNHIDGQPWSGTLEDLAHVQGKTWGHGDVVDPKGWSNNVKLAVKFTNGTAGGKVGKSVNESRNLNEAPTNDDIVVDLSNILAELEELIATVEVGNTETPDMGGPDMEQQDTILDFVGDAVVNLKRALSELSRPPQL